MTNWTKKYTHRTMGSEVEVLLIHDYFGVKIHGYKLPSGKVLREEKFNQLYVRSDD